MSSADTTNPQEDSERQMPTTRRRFLALGGAGLAALLAGCPGNSGTQNGDGGGDNQNTPSGTTTPAPATPTPGAVNTPGGGGGGASGASPLARELTRGQGVWYQAEFGQPTSVGVGAPSVRTEASWRFEIHDDLKDGLMGIGSRLTRTVLPNGNTGRWSTPGLGTNFSWRLEGTTLLTFFSGYTLNKREETGTISYDPNTEELTVQSTDWGSGTWVRAERAFNGTGGPTGTTNVGQFTTVAGPQNAFTVEVPAAWNNVQTDQAEADSIYLLSAVPQGQTLGQPTVPGAFVYLIDRAGLDPRDLLDNMDTQIRNCFRSNIQQYPTNSGGLSGLLVRYDGCGGTSASRINFAATPSDNRFLVFGAVFTSNVTDSAPAERIFQSLVVNR